jgi:hypothetical protein
VVSVTSDGVNYIVLSEDGSALVATTGSFTSNVTANGASATVSLTPQTVTIAPTGASTIDNVNIGVNTRGSGAFNTLTANSAVTFTANTTSSSTGTGSLVVTGGVGVSGAVYAAGLYGPLTGTLQTAAQSNITSVGTLTSLNVTGAISGSTTLQVGANPAGVSIGVIGIPNQKRIYGRNTANTADVNMMYINGSDSLVVGPSDVASFASTGLSVTGIIGAQSNNTHAGGSTFDSTGTTQLWLRDTDATINTRNWGFQVSGGDFNILRANDDKASGFVTPITMGQAPANSLVILSSGNVGIGTSSPTALLSISSSTTDAATIHITESNTSGGKNGSIVWRGYYNGTTTLHDSVGISRVNTDDGNSSSYNNSLVFYTRPPGVGQALSARMYINSAGSVGIDTAGPTAKFSVKATEGATGGIRLEHSAGNGPLVNIYQSGSDGQLDLYTGESPTTLRTHISAYGNSYFNAAASGKVGISTTDPKTTLSINSPSHISPGQADGRILNWYSTFSEIPNSSHSISIGNNSADTVQPQHVGLSLFNSNATNNTWSPAITFGGLSTSGNYMNGAAAIAAKLPTNTDDGNFRGGVLHFFTQGTINAQKGLTSKMALSANALALSTELYSTYVRTYQTIDGGSQSVRFCEDNLGRWIVVGKFAANAQVAFQSTWSSVRGLSTSTSQSDATAFSADFGNSFPTEVRIMGSTNFDYWKENRTIDFVYRVPSGRTWATFFNSGSTTGDAMMTVTARYGFKVNGGYDGFGRWNNPNLTDIGMSDGVYTNPSAAYSTPTASAFNWYTTQDGKLSIIHTGAYSGQDVNTTSSVGYDDSVGGFFDAFPSTVSNHVVSSPYSSAVWVMIKLD